MHAFDFNATMYLCKAMYALLRTILFQFAPEAVHVWTMRQLDRAYSIAPIRFLLKRSYQKKSASLHRKLWGIDFPNPVGLAAGFDKNAVAIKALGDLGFFLLDLVRDHRPDGHADEGQAQHPAQDVGTEHGGHPAAHRAGQRVVGQRGHQNAQHDGPGLAKTCGQHQRQQLCLVAHFGQGNDAGGDQKSFHAKRP